MHTRAWLLVAAAILPPACTSDVAAGRLLHWVIRVSSLEDTLAFTSDVLNMTVLRHEENDQPCPLTCNGVFDTPWSKTMVGYGPEDTSYALELTYNCAPAPPLLCNVWQRLCDARRAACDCARLQMASLRTRLVKGCSDL